ncbi:MAG TPA: polysaccharide biosynthesis C-terminal domain-containing protein [Edaphobacter sp.]
MGSKEKSSSSGKILRNSFWYGLETIIETVVFFGTSIAVARYLGPTKLGYFSYINFFVTIVTRTSGTGLASSTRKYMSEFIGQEKHGTARAVYHLAYKYQLLGSVVITALGLAGVLLFGDHSYRLMACLLILSIIPGVMSWVPAQANLALEDASKNTTSAFGYIFTYTLIILLTLHFHWDLVGIASASLIGRVVEMALRTIPLHSRLSKIPLEPLDHDIIARIRRFCIEAMGIQLLMSVVWDRSEMIFLKAFSGLEQIAFYSVSFGLANNLLVIPRVFGGATGITLMVESSRDPSRVRSILDNICRFLLFVVLPVHLGAAAIVREAIHFAYGDKYIGAVPVLIIASILAIPRSFQELPSVLLSAADHQKRTLFWYMITGVLNIALDAVLIPRYGAIGAAWGNGLSQAFGVVVIWRAARQDFDFGFPVLPAIRLFSASLIMALIAFAIGRRVPGMPGLILAVLTAIPVYILLVRLFHGLRPEDNYRLSLIGNRLPSVVRRPYMAVVSFITTTPQAEAQPQ